MARGGTETTAGAVPATMRAVVQESYGPADVLRPAEVATPSVAGRDVLIRVAAAGVDRGTWHVMTGRPLAARLGLGLRRPRQRIPGRDVAGTVVAVGGDVSRFAPGDDVLGVAAGSFAQYAVGREDQLVRRPARLSAAQAATVPVSGLTALQALRRAGRVAPGQSVLVTGASGGVGTFAVQLAVAFGADVTAVCSAAKRDLVLGLGAHHVLDYARDDVAGGSRRYDLVVDIAGNASLARLRRTLTPRGTAVIVGGETGGRLLGGFDRALRALALSPFVRQRLVGLVSVERGADLEALAELVEAGSVTPCLDRTFPLEQAADALRYLESGAVRGKVAVVV